MSASIVAGILLWTGVVVITVAALGLAVMPTGMDRLHVGGLASSVASVAIASSAVVDGMSLAASVELFVVVVVLTVGAPLTNHALARAFRIREQGGWDVDTDVVAASERSDEGDRL